MLGLKLPSVNFIIGVIIAIAIIAMLARFLPASIKQYLVIS